MLALADRAEVQTGAVSGRWAAADPEDRSDAGRTSASSLRWPGVDGATGRAAVVARLPWSIQVLTTPYESKRDYSLVPRLQPAIDWMPRAAEISQHHWTEKNDNSAVFCWPFESTGPRIAQCVCVPVRCTKYAYRTHVRFKNKYVGPPYCRAQTVRWPRRMLAPAESRWVCRRDRQTDGRTPDRYITPSAVTRLT